jgi:hypothetical protein
MVGGSGYGIAIGVKFLPFFASYADSSYWLLILAGGCHGLLAWHASYQQKVDDPFLAELTRLRVKIASRIETLPAQAMRTEVPDLVNQLEHEILPRLQALAVKHRQLGAELASYQDPKRGQIKPSAHLLRELERVYEKQKQVMKSTLQEVVDIDATLSGFIQEGDEAHMVLAMQEWKKNLQSRWETLKELLEE